MFMDMSPGHHHSYYLTDRERVIELNWPPQPQTHRMSLKGRVVRLLRSGPHPGPPEVNVDPEAFGAAVKVLERQDVELAINAFTSLGYEVTVRAPR